MQTIHTITDGSAALQLVPVDIIDRFLASLDVKEKSKTTYRAGVRNFMEYNEAHGITRPTRADVLAYKAHLMGSCSPCTASCYLTAVRGLYAFLSAEGVCPNITTGIKGAKGQRGFKKDSLTPPQANAVLQIDQNAPDGLRDFALVNLLIRTGLRTIEVERANVDDIRQQGGEMLLYIQGKGRDDKDAFVVLTEETHRPIREYLRSRGKLEQGSPLFASMSDRNDGGRLTTRSISRIAKAALVDAGFDSSRLTAHSLRHTAVTLSLLGGATIQEAQQMARHANVNTTLIYAHNIERVAHAPERRVDAILEQHMNHKSNK